MKRAVSSFLTLASCVLALTGCVASASDAADKANDESDAPVDGAFDSFRSPIDHGALTLPAHTTATLGTASRYNAWTFTVGDNAELTIKTKRPASNRPTVDTVLYLYKQNSRGSFGSYIERNDDASSNTLWSRIDTTLEAGTYRVLVKGYSNYDTGTFALDIQCAGAGCAPAQASCDFPSTYYQLRMAENLPDSRVAVYTLATQVTALEKAQIIAAIRESAADDTTTLEQAFEFADEHEINVTDFRQADGTLFTAYEYGAGDNSYGAIFFAGTTTIAVANHDGDLEFRGCSQNSEFDLPYEE